MYEHSERHGYPPEWIGITFSITTFWNGIIAILAGIYKTIYNLSQYLIMKMNKNIFYEQII